MEPHFLGFDPVTLEERFDVVAAQERLDELGDQRGLAALVEKIGLYRITGRLEEANEAAAEAIRVARLQHDREQLVRVKIARAAVLRAEGKREQAIHDLSDSILEAEGNGWWGIVADARRQRALIRFELEEYAAAHEDFNEALVLLVRDHARPREIDTTMVAVGALLDRVGARR